MTSRIAIATGLACVCVASALQAQEVCVECKGPDQTYRCTIKNSEKVRAVRVTSRAVEYVCMTQLAKAGKHQSCRVGTSYSGPCIGQDYQIDVARLNGDDAPAAERPAPNGQTTGSDAAAVSPPPKDAPPKTLEELARDTMSKSKEQISNADQTVKKAGDAVGGTLKKTWDCVATFFSRC